MIGAVNKNITMNLMNEITGCFSWKSNLVGYL